MSDIIIKTENLVKTYNTSKVKTYALRGVTLEIPRGTFSCIIGPSGHGKSTLMHLIGGLDRPTEGRTFIEGTDIGGLSNSKLAELRAQKIGFVFQFFNLLQNLTAKENVETAMMFSKISPAPSLSKTGKEVSPFEKGDCLSLPDRQAGGRQGLRGILMATSDKPHKERARELLSLVSLEDKLDAKPSELSGGQQQRVAIARSLANDPDILLMDEPTGNLDSESEAEVLEHVFKLHKKGKTIVIVTHNSEIAKRAEMVFKIRDGRLKSSS